MSYDGIPPPALDPDVETELKDRRLDPANESEVIKYVAQRIVTNEHLVAFLLTIPTDKRKSSFDALAPHLRFKPRPYTMLMLQKNKVARLMRKRLGFVPKG
jgi:hypothetical protein